MEPVDNILGEQRPVEETVVRDSFKSKGGFGRLMPAARYAVQGLCAASKHEAAFRQEMGLGAVAFIASFWLAPSFTFGVMMNGAIVLVLAFELINSAIEVLADAISMEHHPLLGRAKDLGSAAVMLTLVIAASVWSTALYIRFVQL